MMSRSRPLYFLYSTLIFWVGGMLLVYFTMKIELAIGSPSSTSGLAVLVILPFGLVVGILGFVLGGVYSLIGCYTDSKFFNPSASQFITIVGGIVLLVSFLVPLTIQLAWNRSHSPKVIINKNVLSKETLQRIEKKVESYIQSSEEEKELDMTYNCTDKYEISYSSYSIKINTAVQDNLNQSNHSL